MKADAQPMTGDKAGKPCGQTSLMPDWWQRPVADAMQALDAGAKGLSSQEAARRLRAYGPNTLEKARSPSLMKAVAMRLTNPLVGVLVVASILSAATGDPVSFAVVMLTIAMSTALDVIQEHKAGKAVDALRRTLHLRASALRDGVVTELPVGDLVPGDCVQLAAGDVIPGDGIVLAATDFFVNQSSLSGEAYPVGKGPTRPQEPSREGEGALYCRQAAFMGSAVVSGCATMLVCATGTRTQLGQSAHVLAQDEPPSAFERGIRRFSVMLSKVTMAAVLVVLAVNAAHGRPFLDSLVFAIALAVGLTPELLPMIVSVTLAHGAVRMARNGVIVKRTSAVQDLGTMDVLCTDKTGTLTEAELRVERVVDVDGRDSEEVFQWAWLNSHFESGIRSPLDDAILRHRALDAGEWRKLDEVPFDFERRRVSVLLSHRRARVLVLKGAPEDILRLSTAMGGPDRLQPLDPQARERLSRWIDAQGSHGLRLLAVATRHVSDETADVSASDEHDFVLAGFVAFSDPPKATAHAALHALARHGVAVKIVTGDSEAVTRHVCDALGVEVKGVLNGADIAVMDDAVLRAAADRTNLFCRATPEQKNRIVRALQAGGHVVGYMGDGINDAPPLHSADVGISVDSAVDVAREAADLVLSRHDLNVLRSGLREGRRTLLNVNKYVLMATSSNFGNMASMALASLFLPFLPMMPVQILLNNLLYDTSELAIPTDKVREDDITSPRRWDMSEVRHFMLCFGALSSVFDVTAFFLLAQVLRVPQAVFQSAWFVQSLCTQVLVIFLIRTTRPAWRDRPSKGLTLSAIGVTALACVIPSLPWSRSLGFTPLPVDVWIMVLVLTTVYLACVEAAKQRFFRNMRGGRRSPLMR